MGLDTGGGLQSLSGQDTTSSRADKLEQLLTSRKQSRRKQEAAVPPLPQQLDACSVAAQQRSAIDGVASTYAAPRVHGCCC
jgi:hypothetical protein